MVLAGELLLTTDMSPIRALKLLMIDRRLLMIENSHDRHEPDKGTETGWLHAKLAQFSGLTTDMSPIRALKQYSDLTWPLFRDGLLTTDMSPIRALKPTYDDVVWQGIGGNSRQT